MSQTDSPVTAARASSVRIRDQERAPRDRMQAPVPEHGQAGSCDSRRTVGVSSTGTTDGFNHSNDGGISTGVEAVVPVSRIDAPPPGGGMSDVDHASGALLAERSAGGDLSAFETLYHTYVGRVFALCLRMCGNRAEAEELTQEAFIRAWRKLPSFRGDSAFSTWMHRLTVNVVLGHKRSTGRREDREAVAGERWYDDGTTTRDHPASTLDLERAIAGLPDRARVVFVLHDIEGYTHAEIASITDVAEGTSKAQLSRARFLLRKALSS